MIKFILNNETIETDAPKGMTALDFVRYEKHLKGTKIGCREGDCGACTVLVGELTGDNTVAYQSMTSCLLPLANIHNKHLVTIEGINKKGELRVMTDESRDVKDSSFISHHSSFLTPVQQFMVEESGTQCGFCTVGFVMSMTGFSLKNEAHTEGSAIAAIDGNICRCTGYKSIERAAKRLTDFLSQKEYGEPSLAYAIDNQLVPTYFDDIPKRLTALSTFQKFQTFGKFEDILHVGGGTDLYVQRHDDMPHTAANHLFNAPILRGVKLENGWFEIGASATVSDVKASSEMNGTFPFLQKHLKLVSSTPIRNMATIAGNLVNASPIGDLTVFLLALNASIFLQNKEGNVREMPLKDFYKGYKTLDKAADEILIKIRFKEPDGDFHSNFEKVSKRTHLDIASVNSAIFLKTEKDIITEAHLAVGGVAPIPLFLQKTADFLLHKKVSEAVFLEANDVMQTEISPISDVRGAADYKRLLAKQLLLAHFQVLFM
jgi:xanthine dehydrogenase small subunit